MAKADDRRIVELRRRTADAVRRSSAVQAKMVERTDVPVAAGDLFVFAETAEQGLEWAVIATEPDRCLVVPADSLPLAGRADVRVTSPEGEPLVLRCRFSVWLERDRFEPSHRTATLEAAAVAAAAERARRLAEGESLAASATEREAEEDPEYTDWKENLAVARDGLRRLSAPGETE